MQDLKEAKNQVKCTFQLASFTKYSNSFNTDHDFSLSYNFLVLVIILCGLALQAQSNNLLDSSSDLLVSSMI